MNAAPAFGTQEEWDGVALRDVDQHPRLAAMTLQRHPFRLSSDRTCLRHDDAPHWNVEAYTVPGRTIVSGEGVTIEAACRELLTRLPAVLASERSAS